MKCLVFVKFLPNGSLAPSEFFRRIDAEWFWLEEEPENDRPKAAVCVAEFDSIQQLGLDLAIMPGAGISNVEVVPVTENPENEELMQRYINSAAYN